MIPEHRIPTHSGEMLLEEFLEPMEISQTKLAEKLGISLQRVNELINGKRGVTPETAWLLSGAFGTTPEFWTNLQASYDLARARPDTPIRRIAGHGHLARAVEKCGLPPLDLAPGDKAYVCVPMGPRWGIDREAQGHHGPRKRQDERAVRAPANGSLP